MVAIATKYQISAPEVVGASRGLDLFGKVGPAAPGGLFLSLPDGETASVELPPKVLEVVRDVLTRLVESREALLVNEEAELSPEQAAKVLGISRPLVYQRMDDGRLAFREVGAHRRVLMRDVLALKAFEGEGRIAAKALADDADDLEVNYARSPESAS